MKSFTLKLVEFTSYFFILLFCYAAISKMIDFENFQIQIAQSPPLSSFSNLTSFGVLIAELGICTLLLFEKSRRLGLYSSFALMIAFTVYIYLILNYSEFIPCSCGGILEKMDWRTHLLFNLATVILAFAAISLDAKLRKSNILKFALGIFAVAILSAGMIIFLYQKSEFMIKKENNFTRRFLQHPIKEDKRLNLGYNSYYFAGASNDSIYLGNYTTPFTLTSVDLNLCKVAETKIIPDSHPFPFKRAQFLVNNSSYYLFDGTVPVIYKGLIGEKTAITLSYGQSYFSQLVNLDSDSDVFALSTFYRLKDIQSLGLLRPNERKSLFINAKLLKKKSDPVFDTDGQLLYDDDNDQLVYIHYYKNQFIVMDSKLHLKATYKTIDTITQPKITVSELSDGKRKMNRPPLVVNKKSTVKYGLLFNESNLIGRNENREMWKSSSVIDVYSTSEQHYIGSFYISKPKDEKKIQFMIADEQLYVMTGNEIIRYRFAQNLSKHFIKGESRKP